MGMTREQMLAEMGIAPIWRERGAEPTPPSVPDASLPPADAVALGRPVAVAVDAAVAAVSAPASDWDGLAAQVAACRACALCRERKQAVFGVGDRRPDWLFIGEGPGAEEDARGEPFVGQAGKLLDAMLDALDLKRGERVYIANAVKCRPPGNRTPEPDEMAACRPFLERQIELLRPGIIVLLGKAAVHALLHDDKALGALRGRQLEYRGIPVVVTYHPAYLLRNLPEKAKAWEDLLFARRCLRATAAPEAGLPF
ncbi:MAG: uracil-DNA glycosylase [Betaproteobacteria bacterium]|nr:uracil-DNA glycosylase [Betaproteobacteria bacterium]